MTAVKFTLEHLEEARNELARRSLHEFITQTFRAGSKRDFIWNWHHEYCVQELQDFADGKTHNLAIFLPTQVGKSEMATRRLPAYILGRNPDRKVGTVSYSEDHARRFDRDIQRIIDLPEYARIFPDTRINSRDSNVEGTWIRNSKKFEIVNHQGFLEVTGIGGPFNGISLDVLIMDDTVKNRQDALSIAKQKFNREWWDAVGKLRLDNEGQILIVNTRWDEDDLAGHIIASKEFDFKVIVLPALKVDNSNPNDPREIGDALWPAKHSRKRYEAQRRANPVVFEAVQQQNPGTPKEILVYPQDWTVIQELPDYSRFWGLDFGHSTSPDCLLEMCLNGIDLYVDEKFYETGMSTDELAEKIKSSGAAGGPIYCDSASSRTIEDLQARGIAAYPAIKGPGSLKSGITFMHNFRTHLTERSQNMWVEKRKYQYPVGPDNKPLEDADPIKAFDHGMDAMRYGVYTYVKVGKVEIFEGSENFY